MSIAASVGRTGRNAPGDVKVVQRLLNAQITRLTPFAPLPEDGICTPGVIAVIEAFQNRIVGIPRPDGRVDPGGRTIRALASPGTGPQPPGMPAAGSVGSGAVAVTYKPDIPEDRRILNAYTIEVIRRAAALAGLKAAVVTSTLRTAEEQAAIMYGNAVKDLSDQYELYGDTGDQILKVYELNRSKPRDVVLPLMVEKMKALMAQGKRPSLHTVTRQAYDQLNIVDVGVNSTRSANPGHFDVDAMTKAFRKLEGDGFIAKFIDETKKSNNCWHIEVRPHAKPLPA